MRNSESHHGTPGANIALPSQQEIDLQIARAKQAQTAGLRRLMAGPFAAGDKRFHHAH